MPKKLIRILKAPILFLLRKPTLWISQRVSSSPNKAFVFKRLTEVYQNIIDHKNEEKTGYYEIDLQSRTTIIFSDHHKGNRKGGDEFRTSEKNYLAALAYYESQQAYYINLGDSEEFWKFNIFSILQHNKATFEAEKAFVKRNAYFKIFGNHDIFWKIDPFAKMYLWQMFDKAINIYEGIVVRVKYGDNRSIDVFCTHGHQGDKNSDGNKFSVWFVAYIWAPLQTFLEININTPAIGKKEKTLHNRYMYEWSKTQENVVLITGHTHQPIFHSYSHLSHLKAELNAALQDGDNKRTAEIKEKINRHHDVETDNEAINYRYRPTYFNAGCCCYSDGSITGIEISDAHVRLVRWHDAHGQSEREVLEQLPLKELHNMFYDR